MTRVDLVYAKRPADCLDYADISKSQFSIDLVFSNEISAKAARTLLGRTMPGIEVLDKPFEKPRVRALLAFDEKDKRPRNEKMKEGLWRILNKLQESPELSLQTLRQQQIENLNLGSTKDNSLQVS